MNTITKKQYDEIKNIDNLSVVSFDSDNRRQMTYSGLSYKTAIEEVLSQQKRGNTCLIIENLPGVEVSWERKDYDKYLVRGNEE